jgi:hypothetical protein
MRTLPKKYLILDIKVCDIRSDGKGLHSAGDE